MYDKKFWISSTTKISKILNGQNEFMHGLPVDISNGGIRFFLSLHQ